MVRRFSSSFTLFFSLTLMTNSSLFAYGETNHRTPSIKKQQELLHLLKQDCGSCHGMLLKGGLGPPLLVKDLENKPIELIINTILYGRPGTAMPPWQGLLSTQDATWLAQQLKTGVIE